MKLVKTHPKKDPVASATYNPKEFRSKHIANKHSRSGYGSYWGWFVISMLLALIAAGIGLNQAGDNNSHTPAPTTDKPDSVSAIGVYAPLRIEGDTAGANCRFWLSDWHTGRDIWVVYVRASEHIETRVPLGKYRGKLLCDSTWKLSTAETFARPLVFAANASGGVTGMVISLTKRSGGNLRTL